MECISSSSSSNEEDDSKDYITLALIESGTNRTSIAKADPSLAREAHLPHVKDLPFECKDFDNRVERLLKNNSLWSEFILQSTIDLKPCPIPEGVFVVGQIIEQSLATAMIKGWDIERMIHN